MGHNSRARYHLTRAREQQILRHKSNFAKLLLDERCCAQAMPWLSNRDCQVLVAGICTNVLQSYAVNTKLWRPILDEPRYMHFFKHVSTFSALNMHTIWSLWGTDVWGVSCMMPKDIDLLLLVLILIFYFSAHLLTWKTKLLQCAGRQANTRCILLGPPDKLSGPRCSPADRWCPWDAAT